MYTTCGSCEIKRNGGSGQGGRRSNGQPVASATGVAGNGHIGIADSDGITVAGGYGKRGGQLAIGECPLGRRGRHIHRGAAAHILAAGVLKQFHTPVPHGFAAGLHTDKTVGQDHEVVALTAAFLDPETQGIGSGVESSFIAKSIVIRRIAAIEDSLNTGQGIVIEQV